MILYKSTRGKDKKLYTFSEAILKGIALDGGLLSPIKIPEFSLKQLSLLKNESYQQIALFIFNLFQTDLSKSVLEKIVNTAYSGFDHPDIVPVAHLKDNQYFLELWHGPTLAFKDMALQIMPFFFSEAIKKENKHYLILVATSGDTGTAALEGYKDKKGISIMVFYPSLRVSLLQQLQMTTQQGGNVSVFAVKGDFDQVQQTIKEVFNDKKFNSLLFGKHQIVLSSANSINWGRLLPQTVYYVSAYIELFKQGKIQLGEVVDVVVPTGNFGNILASFIARKMGLPIRKLICASNENNVLTEFLQKGVYDIKNRSLVQTPSPSMDILIASNLERLLYFITKDEHKISLWMKQLNEKKKFVVDGWIKKLLQQEFYADWVSNKESLSNIKKTFGQTGYLMDPHTSVAHVVAERYSKKAGKEVPLLICATAHWAKFAKNIYQMVSTSKSKRKLTEFEMLKNINAQIPDSSIIKFINKLENSPIIHTGECMPDKEAVEEIILEHSLPGFNSH